MRFFCSVFVLQSFVFRILTFKEFKIDVRVPQFLIPLSILNFYVLIPQFYCLKILDTPPPKAVILFMNDSLNQGWATFLALQATLEKI